MGNLKLLMQMLKELENNPSGKSLSSYLNNRNAMPEINVGNRLTNSIGEFNYTGKSPGFINVSPNSDIGTLIHELTHAAKRQMVYQYYDHLKGTRPDPVKRAENPQFYDAYEKLDHRTVGRPDRTNQQGYANRIAGYDLTGPKSTHGDKEYRYSETELPAFGLGNMYERWPDRAPQHVDASLATEMEILLDLANRSYRRK